jgi:hypothetical protein
MADSSFKPSKFVNPYEIFVGQLWQGIERQQLFDALHRQGAFTPDVGCYMVGGESL